MLHQTNYFPLLLATLTLRGLTKSVLNRGEAPGCYLLQSWHLLCQEDSCVERHNTGGLAMRGCNPQLLPSTATLAWGCSWDLSLWLMEGPGHPLLDPLGSAWYSVCSPDPTPTLVKNPVPAAAAQPQGPKECPGSWSQEQQPRKRSDAKKKGNSSDEFFVIYAPQRA